MSKIKRSQTIKIRVTPEEYQELLEICPTARLAPWMRDVCLGKHIPKQRKISTHSPVILKNIAVIKNNIRLLTKTVSIQSWTPIERLNIALELNQLGRKLDKLLN